MLKFTRLDKEVNILAPFMEECEIEFCDYSIGAKYLWRDEFKIDYAIYNDTLIMKESCDDYNTAFYYPIGKDVKGALEEIEKYCQKEELPLFFCCIDNEKASYLLERYPFSKVINERDWSDYIYTAEQFKTYSGKKLSGQRNHVNKFKKLYPDYEFSVITKDDFSDIDKFLTEYERVTEFTSSMQVEEDKKLRDYIFSMQELNQVGGVIRVNGKIVALSVGERVRDTLIVHIEKGLREYQGVYPTMASEFAKAFAVNGVKYINREEDCGEMGLRISKLQYQPIEVKEKNNIEVLTAFSKLEDSVKIKTERLTLSEITPEDKEEYKNLYLDDELNRLWGYDYREDLGDNKPTADYFYSFNKELREKKEELSLIIKKDDEFIGEIVLHEFDFYGNVRIGFRLKKDKQKKGYAFESATALIDYAFNKMGVKKVYGKCFKENAPSKALFTKLGFTNYLEDKEYFYFELN
jgi:predicted acetyltransferase